MILTAELASAIVERAMQIIHHNVNVINTDGIIVASGDKNRIGELHEIGLEVARQGRAISIYDEDVSLQAPSRPHYAPGINTPIMVDGKVVFVVGVSGNPNEISRYAALAVLTAELLTKQAIKNREINWSRRFSDMLLIKCLKDEQTVDESSSRHLAALFDFSEPRSPYLIQIRRLDGRTDKIAGGSCLQEILRRLAVELENDQVSLLEEDLMLLLSPVHDGVFPYRKVMEQVCAERGMQMVLIKGLKVINVSTLLKSLRFARYCLSSAGHSLDCNKAGDVLATALCRSPYAFLLSLIRERLALNKMSQELQQTVRVYMQENLELQQTARLLNIHRNTLKNRFKIIKDATGLDPDSIEDLLLLYFAFSYREGTRDSL